VGATGWPGWKASTIRTFHPHNRPTWPRAAPLPLPSKREPRRRNVLLRPLTSDLCPPPFFLLRQLFPRFPQTIFQNANLKILLFHRKTFPISRFHRKPPNENRSHGGNDKLFRLCCNRSMSCKQETFDMSKQRKRRGDFAFFEFRTLSFRSPNAEQLGMAAKPSVFPCQSSVHSVSSCSLGFLQPGANKRLYQTKPSFLLPKLIVNNLRPTTCHHLNPSWLS
jgi:hypothetical protein